MRVPYKPFPVKGAPGFKDIDSHWLPVLTVAVIHHHKACKRFEAIVDSGSPWCLFHAAVGRSIGINIENGEVGRLGGVIRGASEPVYFHNVKIRFLEHIVDATAGFTETLSVAGILGRQSFFDNCTVTFDPSSAPGHLDITRLFRS